MNDVITFWGISESEIKSLETLLSYLSAVISPLNIKSWLAQYSWEQIKLFGKNWKFIFSHLEFFVLITVDCVQLCHWWQLLALSHYTHITLKTLPSLPGPHSWCSPLMSSCAACSPQMCYVHSSGWQVPQIPGLLHPVPPLPLLQWPQDWPCGLPHRSQKR